MRNKPSRGRKFVRKIHPLADPEKSSGSIVFVHPTDGKEHTFASVVNQMSGDRLSWFDDERPSVNDGLRWVKSVFRDIRKKSAKVIECVGDF